MTNFLAIEEFKRKSIAYGLLVPDCESHTFAGITRSRWRKIVRAKSVPFVTIAKVNFVPLTWIQSRPTRKSSPHRKDKKKAKPKIGTRQKS